MKKYSIIYADPPWAYRTYSKKGQGRSAESHYPTMCIEDIKALPVGELAAKDCALFLWITFPCLCEALEVLTAWGFSYKTVAFVWVKQNRRNDDLFTGMENMGVGELLGLSIETLLISLCLKIMAILITVILYGRMIEIYCTVSIAPIPIATMSNREWGSIGTNYLKGLFALAFQGFLIMVCVGIYAVLINGMIIADNIHSALFSVAAYTVILCFSLFKTGSLAKSIFHAH